MEDIIDLLRERNQPVPVPLELPDEDLLIETEEEMSVSLPDDYRAFLLTVSDVVYGYLEPATITDPRSHTYLPDLAARAWDEGLPRKYLAFCEYADGYYCLREDGKVKSWHRDDGMIKPSWDSIWRWAEDIWLAEY